MKNFSKVLTATIFYFIINQLILSSAGAQFVAQSTTGPTVSYDLNLKAKLVSTGLDFPTSMVFLHPNDILVLEKNQGTVKRIVNGTILSEPVVDVNVANKNEMGLLGIAVITKKNQTAISDNTKHTYVFLYFTASDRDGGEPIANRLYRYELLNNELVNAKLLLEVPWGLVHNGGKLIVGPDKNLYLTAGEVGHLNAVNYENNTKFDKTAGILRFDFNGKPIINAPLGKTYPTNLYYAYGIRNSFGIDFDPISKKLWDTENGPTFGDEINLVEPGFNSGWKMVQGYWNVGANDTQGEVVIGKPTNLVDLNGTGKYSKPEFAWNYSVGPTAIKFLKSDKLGKQYENDLFVSDFHEGNIYHFDLNKDRKALFFNKSATEKISEFSSQLENNTFARGFGGITDMQVGPDGYLYVLATSFGGADCNPNTKNNNCVHYNSTNAGSLFRIAPSN